MTKKVHDWVNGQEVLNVLHSYAWAFDTNDKELLASVFSEHAKTGGIVKGTTSGWGPWEGRDEIVRNLGAIRDGQTDRRRHQITTPLFVSLTDNQAEVKIYLSLFGIDASKNIRLVTTGEYSAKLSKTDGQWCIDVLDAMLDGAF
ncbi:hypothetical protein FX985_02849 [Pseudomonas extremaustralis]|uniref:SnoaL-like domain-containing protein n=1 Tax=Pseudomonas extremaustralis TaxID=359110 RepID=A0A5M9J2Z6_9PSED|nr:nuclear transport factor 2 family protein [Pseudomonas extremaustralis]KAA8562783.1 hypothetical protein FX985_02849 [Pseudomonas extremaustralis]